MFQFPIPKTSITVLPILGFALILFSVLRMEKMEPIFKKAKIILLIALPISAALLGLQIYGTAGGQGAWYSYTYNAVRILTELAEISATVFIYIGIKIIGVNTELPTLEKQSARNMTLMLVYLVVYLAINLINLFAPSLFTGFEFVKVWPFVIGYVWRALNIWMAFTLLAKISASQN